MRLKSNPGDKKVGSAGLPGGEGGGGEAATGLGGEKVTCLAASARPKPAVINMSELSMRESNPKPNNSMPPYDARVLNGGKRATYLPKLP